MPALSNPKHETFAREYARCRSGAEAARRAGYQYAAPDQAAYDLLRYPRVKARITELSNRLLEKVDVKGERLVLELARQSHVDYRRFFVARLTPDGEPMLHPDTGEPLYRQKRPDELDDDEAACVKGTDRNGAYVFWDKVASQTILAKHLKVIGDEGEGVSALATALADRLTLARRRVDGPPAAVQDAHNREVQDVAPRPRRPVIDTSADYQELAE